jgi:hypothetical protein
MSKDRPRQGRSAVPPPVPKIDANTLIDELRTRYGVVLEYLGPAGGGEVGAAFVRTPEGHDAVLTRAGDGSAATGRKLRTTVEVLDLARSRGVAAPRYFLIAQLGGSHVVVQERLPGRTPETVDAPLVQRLMDATAPWEGLLTGRHDLPRQSMYLTGSGPGYCLHESLAAYDQRTRRLLDRVHRIGDSGPGEFWGEDLAHLDYHAGNVLVGDDDEVSGIIDWDGWTRGDRWFSLEVLAFDVAGRRVDRDVLETLTGQIEAAVPPERLRAYRAHLGLRLVDWAIRHHDAATVDLWLAVATARLESLD